MWPETRMRDSQKVALMSGTLKFSGGSGVAFGNGRRSVRSSRRIALDTSGPAQPPAGRTKRVLALMLLLAIAGVAVAQYSTGRGLIPIAWLSIGPLLASLLLPLWITA